MADADACMEYHDIKWIFHRSVAITKPPEYGKKSLFYSSTFVYQVSDSACGTRTRECDVFVFNDITYHDTKFNYEKFIELAFALEKLLKEM